MTFAFLQSNSDATNLTTYTWASQNLGTASSDRYIIIAVISRQVGTTTPTISSATIGGVSATIVRQNNSGTTNLNTVGFIMANVPTGTTGDVVVTFGSGQVRAAIGMYAATGINTTPTDQGSSTAGNPTYAIDVVAGGFAIGAAYDGNATATTTWTGITENYDANLEAAITYSGASATFGTTQTNLSLTADFTGTDSETLGVFVSFAPLSGKTFPARHIFRR